MEEEKVDHVLPKEKWEFDQEVTDVFGDMLRRSIPQYEVMRQGVFDVGRKFVVSRTTIVDIGCSRGDALVPFIEKFGAYNTYVGVEVSPAMVAACRNRFRGMIENGLVDIKEMDLRGQYPAVTASLTLAVLTLMFVPIEHRQRVVRASYQSLIPGGALVMVEKVLGSTAPLDGMLVDLYYDMKRAQGYNEEEIVRKKLSLEGVLVPVTARWNEDLLRAAGFAEVECFWRWMNFAAWVAVKSP